MKQEITLSDEYPMIQSEGHMYGACMYMVRFQGCSVMQCPIRMDCDEQGALSFDSGYKTTVDEIMSNAESVLHSQESWLHISGGEPCNQPDGLRLLTREAHRRGFRVQIQTSGLVRVPAKWDWLTVSPKVKARELAHKFGQELKVIYTGQTDAELAQYYHLTKFADYYLQPLWKGSSCNHKETANMVFQMNRQGIPWKMSFQVHKFVGAK